MPTDVSTGAAPTRGPTDCAAAVTPAHAPATARHVLVCLDRSPLAESVLPHALALARSCGARITLLHVLEPDHHAEAAPVDPLAWEIQGAEGRQYLDGLAARHRSRDIAMESAVIEGQAADQIRAWGAHHDVDITVLCTHGESGSTEWRFASTAQKLIEGMPGSVLLVPATTSPAAGHPTSYAHVLVPLDGSAYGESVLPLAVQIARTHGAELILAHVVPVPELTRIGPLSREDLDLEERLVRRNWEVGHAYLERVRSRLAEPGLRVRTVLARDTDPRRELVHLVEREHADLVVLSAHGGSGRVEEPCGSVAAHLLAHCATPVLVVRERRRAVAHRRGPVANHRHVSVRMPALAVP
jgi:nucleotide-binding universal stress UspA family protein